MKMNDRAETIAKNIKNARKKAGMTQAELALILGYSEKAISKWECAQGMPPTLILPDIARVLGVSLDELLCRSQGKRLFLGIDGGGTKTDFVLADENGNVLRQIKLDACNPNDVGIDAAKNILRAGIHECLSTYRKSDVSVFAGIAGSSSSKNSTALGNFLGEFGFEQMRLGSDAENAVAASLGKRNGIAVIMGTGTVAFAKKKDRLYRVGGYGQLFGDAGSGFAIGRDVVLAALECEDGSGEDTVLYDLVKEKCGSDRVLSLLDEFYRGGKRLLAQYAPLAFSAYLENDAKAREIIEKNVGAVAKLIRGAAKKIDREETTVSICGGLAAHKEIILPILRSYLSEMKIKLEICEKPMVYGALLLAGMEEGEYNDA